MLICYVTNDANTLGEVGFELHADINSSVADNTEMKCTRKRKSNLDLWKRNIQKRKIAEGQQYVTTTGKMVRCKDAQPINCEKCRFRRTDHVSSEQRQLLCSSFYQMADYTRQKDFIVNHVSETKPKKAIVDANKHHTISRSYYLPVNGNRV